MSFFSKEISPKQEANLTNTQYTLYVFCEFLHGNSVMCLLVGTLAVFDQQYLGRLMVHRKHLCHFCRYGAIRQQVKVIKINAFGRFSPFQPALGHHTDATARTVFENDDRPVAALLSDRLQLCFRVKGNPIHRPNLA